MLKIVSILIAISLLFPIAAFVGCGAPPPPRTFKDLIENKVQYAKELGPREYTDGLIIYLTKKDSNEFFVATYPGVSKDGIKDEFVIVKTSIKGLAVGDIVSVKGGVAYATGKTKDGKKVIVYYLDGWKPIKTGQVNIDDPNFEELIQIINEEIQRADAAMFMIIIMSMTIIFIGD